MDTDSSLTMERSERIQRGKGGNEWGGPRKDGKGREDKTGHKILDFWRRSQAKNKTKLN